MNLRKLKKLAALQAVGLVESGMRIGLGSGSTVRYAISEIGRRVRSGKLDGLTAVAASRESESLARENGIEVVELNAESLDLTIDGADEISPKLDLIKGLGAALLREKMIALQSKEFIVIADQTKIVNYLGEKNSLPIEIVCYGFKSIISRLFDFGSPVLRVKNNNPVVTDNGNYIVDLKFSAEDISTFSRNLKQLTGVVETGLFLGLANRAFVAFENEVKELKRENYG